MKILKVSICLLLLWAAGACGRTDTAQSEAETEEAAPQNLVYGIDADAYRLETGEVGSGETLGKILGGYGISAQEVDLLDRKAREIWTFWPTRSPQPNTSSSDFTAATRCRSART